MKKTLDLAGIHSQFQTFFEDLGDFYELNQKGRISFVRSFLNHDLAIKVTTPLRIQGGNLVGIEKYSPIEVAVLYHGKNCLALTNCRLTERTWEESLTGRILALTDLNDEIRNCSKCKKEDIFYIPEYEVVYQANPKGTPIVRLVCPICGERNDTTFRKQNCLKSRLHSYLPRPVKR